MTNIVMCEVMCSIQIYTTPHLFSEITTTIQTTILMMDPLNLFRINTINRFITIVAFLFALITF